MNLGLSLGLVSANALLKAANAAFTPDNLSGLTLWLDASDTNTLWEDTSATTTATTVVGRWDDKSGNGNNATQSNASYKPTTGTRTINGLNVIDFDGTDDAMALPSALYTLPNGDHTVFIVSQKDSTGNMVSLWGDSTGGDWGYYWQESNVTSYGGGKSVAQSITGDILHHIYGSRQDSISRDSFFDGQQNFAGASANTTVTSMYIGVNPPNVLYTNGTYQEIIAYNRRLTDSEMVLVGAYLAQKWAAKWEDWHESGLISGATTNYIGENQTTITGYTHMVNYVPFVIPEDGEYLRLSDTCAFYTATSQALLSNSFTVEDRALVSDALGTAVQVTWNGETSKEIPRGYVDLHSDKIYASSFGLSKFTKGEIYYIKSIESVPSSGGYYPIHGRLSVSQIGLDTQTAWYNPANTTVSTVLESGQFSATGTPLANATYAYRPVVVMKPIDSSAKSVIGIGDSITYGSGDSGTPQIHGIGYLQRAIREGGDYLPSINHGRNSITAANTNIFTYWRFFLRYSNIAVVALGTNDMSGAVSAATLQARLQDTWSIIRQSRVSNIIELPLITKASSTDGYLTTINQTIDTNWLTVPDEVNTWLDTKVADNTIEAVIDRSGIVDSIEPYKWGVDGVTTNLYNSDTVHPNANGCAVLATSTRATIDAL